MNLWTLKLQLYIIILKNEILHCKSDKTGTELICQEVENTDRRN